MMEPSRNKIEPVPDFAPDDPTDNRVPGDWKTRYPDKVAQSKIRWEAIYLAGHLLLVPVALIILFLLESTCNTWFNLQSDQYKAFLRFAYAWLGGILAGTLFDIKWLYHSVARNLWNIDRRLWRLFVPHISGSLAFAVHLLMSSGIFRIFDQSVLDSLKASLAIGFIVGYFSDTATAKLREIAETLFGSVEKRDHEVRLRNKQLSNRSSDDDQHIQ